MVVIGIIILRAVLYSITSYCLFKRQMVVPSLVKLHQILGQQSYINSSLRFLMQIHLPMTLCGLISLTAGADYLSLISVIVFTGILPLATIVFACKYHYRDRPINDHVEQANEI